MQAVVWLCLTSEKALWYLTAWVDACFNTPQWVFCPCFVQWHANHLVFWLTSLALPLSNRLLFCFLCFLYLSQLTSKISPNLPMNNGSPETTISVISFWCCIILQMPSGVTGSCLRSWWSWGPYWNLSSPSCLLCAQVHELKPRC